MRLLFWCAIYLLHTKCSFIVQGECQQLSKVNASAQIFIHPSIFTFIFASFDYIEKFHKRVHSKYVRQKLMMKRCYSIDLIHPVIIDV